MDPKFKSIFNMFIRCIRYGKSRSYFPTLVKLYEKDPGFFKEFASIDRQTAGMVSWFENKYKEKQEKDTMKSAISGNGTGDYLTTFVNVVFSKIQNDVEKNAKTYTDNVMSTVENRVKIYQKYYDFLKWLNQNTNSGEYARFKADRDNTIKLYLQKEFPKIFNQNETPAEQHLYLRKCSEFYNKYNTKESQEKLAEKTFSKYVDNEKEKIYRLLYKAQQKLGTILSAKIETYRSWHVSVIVNSENHKNIEVYIYPIIAGGWNIQVEHTRWLCEFRLDGKLYKIKA